MGYLLGFIIVSACLVTIIGITIGLTELLKEDIEVLAPLLIFIIFCLGLGNLLTENYEKCNNYWKCETNKNETQGDDK